MNVLFSYWHMNRAVVNFVKAAGEDAARVMMDSGAYTVYKQGEKITLGEYMVACKKLEPYLFSYIMLDVIRDKEATKRNLDLFLDKGLSPMPVWTTDSNLDDLAFLRARIRSGKICIAGGATEKIDWYGPRLQAARDFLGPDLFIHGLGFTAKGAASCPVDSIDSSSYKEAGRFGTLSLYAPEHGLKRVNIGTLRREGFAAIPSWAQKCIIDSGLDENIGKEKQSGIYSKLYLLGLSAWMDFARDLKRHGIRLFFAVANEHELVPLALVGMHKGPNGHIDWQAIEEERQELHEGVSKNPEEFAIYFKEASCRQELLW